MKSNTNKYNEALEADIATVMPLLMSQITQELNKYQYDAVYEMVLKKIMGLDGNKDYLSSDDFSLVSKNVYTLISYVQQVALQASKGISSGVNEKIVTNILKEIFDIQADELPQYVESWVGDYSLANEISNAYLK